jgi:hypothetical protein
MAGRGVGDVDVIVLGRVGAQWKQGRGSRWRSDVENAWSAPTSPVKGAARGAWSDRKERLVKYVILIHANPDPWGHPTSIYTPQGRALPAEQHEEMDRQFEALLEEISASGEFVTAEAPADPASATLYGWSPEGHLATDGPYGEAKEQLAGFSSSTVPPESVPRRSPRSSPSPGVWSSSGR